MLPLDHDQALAMIEELAARTKRENRCRTVITALLERKLITMHTTVLHRDLAALFHLTPQDVRDLVRHESEMRVFREMQ